MRLWGNITKVTENEDGTLIVGGIASSEAVDADGEIITSEAMRAAIPDYMKFGAVREMHGNSAAGTAVNCEVQEDGRTFLEALVVDPVAVKKVKTGTYKGFSIGGKVQARNKTNRNIIEAIKLVEISLVDRPANPEAIIGLVKMEDTEVDPETNTAEVETPVAPVLEKGEDAPDAKAEALANLKKWAGEEVFDAGIAIQALDAIMFLLAKETEEPGEPAEQVAALKDAVAAIKAFIASEIMEDNSEEMKEGEEVALSEDAADLEKKGAKFSVATKSELDKAHKALAAAHEEVGKCIGAIGKCWDQKDEDVADSEKSEDAEDLTKAAVSDELMKVESERDEALQKAAVLQRELDALKAMKPLKAVPVEKSTESAITKSEVAGAEPAAKDPLDAMRKVHAAGGRIITTTRLG